MFSSVLIRPAAPADIPALSELAIVTYTAAFGNTFTPSDLAAHLEQNLSPSRFAQILQNDNVLVAVENNKLIGYTQFGDAHPNEFPTAHPGDQELRRIYLLPAWQNKGIGTELLDAALAHPRLQTASHIYLDVWEHNHGAQRLYQRYGFQVVGSRKFRVESGGETGYDLLMVRRAPLA